MRPGAWVTPGLQRHHKQNHRKIDGAVLNTKRCHESLKKHLAKEEKWENY
jgi:hypothetical protein